MSGQEEIVVGHWRKKPVVIEAVHFTDAWQGMNLADWCGGEFDGLGSVFIGTLEGTMTANVGDWIIKGLKGEFYPCDPEVFAMTYEAAP